MIKKYACNRIAICILVMALVFGFGGYPAYAASCPSGGNHQYTIHVIKAATETTSGTERHTCDKCGYSCDETIPKIGHNYGSWQIQTHATCIDEGLEQSICSICGKAKYKKVPPTGNHNYGEWVTIQKRTATQDGIKQSTCSICGSTKTKTITTQNPEKKTATTPTSKAIQKKQVTVDSKAVNVDEPIVDIPTAEPIGDSMFNVLDIIISVCNISALAIFMILIRRDTYVINWDKRKRAQFRLEKGIK